MFHSLGPPGCCPCILGPCLFNRYWQPVPLKSRKWPHLLKPKRKELCPPKALGHLGSTADLWTTFGIIPPFAWRLTHVLSLIALLASPVASPKSFVLSHFCPNWYELTTFLLSTILTKLVGFDAINSGPSHRPRGLSIDLLWINQSLFLASAKMDNGSASHTHNLFSNWLSSHNLDAVYRRHIKKMQYGYNENSPNLQVLFSFCLAVSSQFISLTFYYRQQEETRLCLQHLEMPSAKYLSSSLTNSTFHKNTIQPSSLLIYNKNHHSPSLQ